MILVDSSVWIDHLRVGSDQLRSLLEDGDVVCHSFIIGEMACGNLKNRAEIISLFEDLPMAIEADHKEIMSFIEKHRLMGQGLGYIDVHLLASALLTQVPLWTFDLQLKRASTKLGIAYSK